MIIYIVKYFVQKKKNHHIFVAFNQARKHDDVIRVQAIVWRFRRADEKNKNKKLKTV